ncbi:MAG TPA: hypothetical protein VGM90_34130 [Kofleriaceae bacterium]|jgi:hypothetical protein
MRLLATSLIATLAVACTNSSDSPTIVPTPPDHGVHSVITLPQGGAASALFGPGATFLIHGPTAPGSASVTGAPVLASPDDGANPGSGAFDLTVDGTNYAATSSVQSLAFLDDEGSGTQYAEIIGFAERDSGSATVVDEVVVIVRASDVTPGATIALDGVDRIALFVSGDESASEPSVFAAAETGSVTISAGTGAVGSSISLSVTGDFGSVQFVDDPTGGGGGGGDPTAPLIDGAYSLSISGTADVYCDGSLAGQESNFASITPASLGLTNDDVALSNGGLAIAGGTITTAFGASPFALADSGDGYVIGSTDENAAGPAGTTLIGKFIAFDKASASATFVNGAVGAGYVVDDGQCSISFSTTLTGL